jgi:uncharacterized membrane protein YdfJ with MMPL/SSD domain
VGVGEEVTVRTIEDIVRTPQVSDFNAAQSANRRRFARLVAREMSERPDAGEQLDLYVGDDVLAGQIGELDLAMEIIARRQEDYEGRSAAAKGALVDLILDLDNRLERLLRREQRVEAAMARLVKLVTQLAEGTLEGMLELDQMVARTQDDLATLHATVETNEAMRGNG